MAIETALAKARSTPWRGATRPSVYHKMTRAELQALTPALRLERVLQRRRRAADRRDQRHRTRVLQGGRRRWWPRRRSPTSRPTCAGTSRTPPRPCCPKPFVDENFRFYGTTLTGAKELRPRWKRCVQYTDGDLGEALGKAFVKEAFGAGGEGRHAEDGARASRPRSRTTSRASPGCPTRRRRQALVKLHAVANKIGYPDRWRDYIALTHRPRRRLGNSQRANAFEFRRQLTKIGKPRRQDASGR